MRYVHSRRWDRRRKHHIEIIKEITLSQPFTFQAANNRSPVHTTQLIFTVLALLAFVLGSLLMILVWFGVGVTIPTDKLLNAEPEIRAFVFIIVWPVTLLVVWICSTIALLLAKRWVLASFSLPAAIVILLGVWWLVAMFMLTASALMFTAFFMLLITGAIWLVAWFLRSASR
jgi:hypothetical protein